MFFLAAKKHEYPQNPQLRQKEISALCRVLTINQWAEKNLPKYNNLKAVKVLKLCIKQ